MSTPRLTPRPRLPVLVHMAALSLGVPWGCGDDGDGETQATATTNDSSLDDHPTACHQEPSGCDVFPEESTGTGTTGTGTGTGTGTTDATGTGPLPDDTSSTSGDAGTGTGTSTTSG